MNMAHARVEWVHPTLGRISEIQCIEHREEVTLACRALAQAPLVDFSDEAAQEPCFRCVHWLDGLEAGDMQAALAPLVAGEVERELRRRSA